MPLVNYMRRHWMLGTVVLLSALFRIIYYAQLQAGPCFWQHRWMQSDMNYFDTWGRQIAAGDWLSKSIAVPMHHWQLNVAMEYLDRHLDELSVLQAQAANDPDPYRVRAVARALWTRWNGQGVFYQDPLYPYLLAIVYLILRPDPHWAFFLQMLVGMATNILIFLIARRIWGVGAGFLAGILAVAASPLLYYELILKRESLIVAMSLMLVWLAILTQDRPHRSRWFALGLAWGLALLLKSTFWLLGLGLVAGLAFIQRHKDHPGKGVIFFSAGLVLALLPLIGRNVAVGAPPLSLASGGTVTFVSHNARDYDARMSGFAEWGSFHVSTHFAQIMDRSQGRFLPALMATLRTHTPGSYLRQLANKFAAVWHWYEIPNNTNFYFYRLYAPILYLPATFALIGPLGVLGLLVGLPHWRKAWPLYTLVVTAVIPLLAFYTSSRLRLPLVAGLIPFGAAAIVRLWSWTRMRRFWHAGLSACLLSLAAIAINRPLPKGMPLLRYADCAVPFEETYYTPRIQQALLCGDLPRALDEYHQVLDHAPAFIRACGPTRGPVSMAEAGLVNFYAHRYREYAELLGKAGKIQEAKEAFLRAEGLGATLHPFIQENR